MKAGKMSEFWLKQATVLKNVVRAKTKQSETDQERAIPFSTRLTGKTQQWPAFGSWKLFPDHTLRCKCNSVHARQERVEGACN